MANALHFSYPLWKKYTMEECEFVLVEKAYVYLVEKRYPSECDKNEKRRIRRKAEST